MTAVVAWQRSVGSLSELVVACDSRVSGGERWDACPKIFSSGRDDAVLAFAGDTARALPLILQAIATIGSYLGSERRSLDLPKLAGHLERVMNQSFSEARGRAADDPQDCELLLCGWSWSLNSFRIYRYFFDNAIRAFRYYHVSTVPPSIGGRNATALFATIGDAGRRLVGRMARKMRNEFGRIEYEPLDALLELIEDPAQDTVGGPIQIAKVYQSIRVEPFAVRIDGEVYVAGRRRLAYENLDLRIIGRNGQGDWQIEGQVQRTFGKGEIGAGEAPVDAPE